MKSDQFSQFSDSVFLNAARTPAKCLLALLITAAAPAATINWGTPTAVSTTIGNSSQVRTDGTLIQAFNGVTTAQTPADFDVTVNGQSFVGTQDIFSESGAGVGGTSDLWLGGNTGDAAYNTLLSTVDYGGPASQTLTLPLGGGSLIVGQEYLVQIWFVDDRAASNSRVMRFGDGNGNNVDLNDQFVVGTFIASGTTQSLFAEAQGFARAHINAIQLRAIPEPSVSLLGGLGALALLRRRK